jgi:hypothetical protein
MDFIVGLPCTQAGYDSIWVIVGRLTKVAHFIPVKMNNSSAKLAKLYMSRIVCLHRVPKKIVVDNQIWQVWKNWTIRFPILDCPVFRIEIGHELHSKI